MENNITPEMMANKLFQTFQSHGIDIPQEKRKAYTIFSAVQHCNIMAHSKCTADELLFWAEVVNELTKRI